jgi:dihydrofolate reductase
MSKVVVSEFVSLDGVFEDPGGAEGFEHAGWTFKFDRGAEGNEIKLAELRAAGALLLGRVTYQAFAQAWPSMKDEFADKMNSMPKYVVSRALDRGDWNNTTILRGNLPDEIGRLKDQVDGDILVYGSGQLVEGLRAHDLVDEYGLMVFPVVLGSGKRLFSSSNPVTTLRLTDTKPAGDALFLTYEPARKGA